MDFSLYSMKGKKLAEQEADLIISQFIGRMSDWQDKYHNLGARDTASREAFAMNVVDALGLVWPNYED